MRRATVTCEVEVEVILYDEAEYDDDADEKADVWKEANGKLVRVGAVLLSVGDHAVKPSAMVATGGLSG